jgi:putative ABC transport system permease protein
VIRFETLRLALGGLLANRLRSGLTILGLTIGVASVIVLIAVGNGSAQTVQKRIESLGSNVLLVTRSFTLGGSRARNAATTPLTQQDVDALNDRTSAPDVASASPVVNANTTLVSNGVSYQPSSFVGTTPSYLTAHAYDIAAGAAFTSSDVTERRRTLVIGPEA